LNRWKSIQTSFRNDIRWFKDDIRK